MTFPDEPACYIVDRESSDGMGYGSVEEVEVSPSCLHGVDHEFVAAVESEDDDLEEAAASVESETQLPGGAVIVQVADKDSALSGIDRVFRVDAVLARGVVHLHPT